MDTPTSGGMKPGSITDAVKASTLAFWNTYLKGDAAAKAMLTSGGGSGDIKNTASIQSK